MLLILDASVVAKWFKEESGSEDALKVREGFYNGVHEIIVPDLLLYELSNALRYDKKFSREEIEKAVKSILEMDLTITIPSQELITKSVEAALDYEITVYDAIYIVLSLQMNGIFVTADEKLYRKISKLKNCKLLSGHLDF